MAPVDSTVMSGHKNEIQKAANRIEVERHGSKKVRRLAVSRFGPQRRASAMG